MSTDLEGNSLSAERVAEFCLFVSLSLKSMNERDSKVVRPSSMKCKTSMA